jgi:hypothetical protein
MRIFRCLSGSTISFVLQFWRRENFFMRKVVPCGAMGDVVVCVSVPNTILQLSLYPNFDTIFCKSGTHGEIHDCPGFSRLR